MNQLIISSEEAQKGFYPTPDSVIELLVEGLNFKSIKNVLEPSAGKGNIVFYLKEKYRELYDKEAAIDCCEIDPALRHILEGLNADYDEKHYSSCNVRLVHDDFLTFETKKRYDLIIMNPPFAEGSKHLLKAIQLLEPYGGEIRCILNAETIDNPYSRERKELCEKLKENNAEISYLENAFLDAERKTGVKIAIIKLSLPEPVLKSKIVENLKKAKQQEEQNFEAKELSIGDYVEQIVAQYNFEVEAGLNLIREYKAMCPYILSKVESKDEKESSCYDNSPILQLLVHGNKYKTSENSFIEAVREKYWKAVFENPKFTKKLTSDLQTEYYSQLDTLREYEFSVFNLQQLLAKINVDMSRGVQESILRLFDEMTEKHSWYPECEKNIHYFNGWKTNKVHKINQKVILPFTKNIFYDDNWRNEILNEYYAVEELSDIEKIFNYFDGDISAPVYLETAIREANMMKTAKNIRCKFFDVTFYKKGTMHIKFRRPELVDAFNIYCCKNKGWLPPTYGSKPYEETSKEEKEFIDGFNGDGTEGSGKGKYNEIVKDSKYYLHEPTKTFLSLSE